MSGYYIQDEYMDKVSQTVDGLRRSPTSYPCSIMNFKKLEIHLDLNLFVASYNPFDEFWSTTDEKFVCKLDLVRVFVV